MHHFGLGTWLAKRRLTTPEKTALIYDDGRPMTYRELADYTDAMSALLQRAGIVPGDRVAVMSENCPEFLMVLFGSAQIGAVFVPINTRLAPPEVEHVLSDSGARALVHGPEFDGMLKPISDRLKIAQRFVTGENAADSAQPLRPILRQEPHGHAQPQTTLDDPALIMYTSGTTGKAKGAVLTHGNLTWVSINTALDYDIVSGEVALMISPMFHAAALGMGALPIVLKGATLVLEQSFDAGRTLDLIERYGVTSLSGVPTTYQLLADHERWPTTNLSTLTKLTCGGSAVPTRILDAYADRGLGFTQGYGMTETSPGASYLRPEQCRTKQGSVGVGHFFTDVRITDPETGVVVPQGTVGEIEVHGPNVFAGYHNLPDATASAFSPDGWFRSGDLGYLDADGYLFIADRLKDMIISGGENIYPAEVEDHLNSIAGVTGAAVVGVPNAQWGEVGWAVLTLQPGSNPDGFSTEAIRASLDGKLARYKLPKNVVIVDEFPRTASGKVRKADLRSRFITPST